MAWWLCYCSLPRRYWWSNLLGDNLVLDPRGWWVPGAFFRGFVSSVREPGRLVCLWCGVRLEDKSEPQLLKRKHNRLPKPRKRQLHSAVRSNQPGNRSWRDNLPTVYGLAVRHRRKSHEHLWHFRTVHRTRLLNLQQLPWPRRRIWKLGRIR